MRSLINIQVRSKVVDFVLLGAYNIGILWPCGGIGIHNRLKICRPIGLAGSSPARATSQFKLRREK